MGEPFDVSEKLWVGASAGYPEDNLALKDVS